MQKKELKENIYTIVDQLNEEDLSTVLEEAEKIYYEKQFEKYANGYNLPKKDSQEYLFLKCAVQFNGNIIKKLVLQLGITNYYFNKFIIKYHLIEVSTGMYIFPDSKIDGLFLLQNKYSSSVISHETALYFLGLSDVIPKFFIMSLPVGYKLSQIEANNNQYVEIKKGHLNHKKGLTVTYLDNDDIFITQTQPIKKEQIITIKNAEGLPIRVTSAERSIIDVLDNHSETEEEIKFTAIQRYLAEQPEKINRLRRFAKEYNVLSQLDYYLK